MKNHGSCKHNLIKESETHGTLFTLGTSRKKLINNFIPLLFS